MKKRAIFTILSLCSAFVSFAQGNGMAGISEATNMVTSYFDPLTKLIFAVAAILGLVGGVRVYWKFSWVRSYARSSSKRWANTK